MKNDNESKKPPDIEDDGEEKGNSGIALGLCFGCAFGTLVQAVTGDIIWLSIGVSVGLGLGLAFGSTGKKEIKWFSNRHRHNSGARNTNKSNIGGKSICTSTRF